MVSICQQHQTIILAILYQHHIFFCVKVSVFEPKKRNLWEVLLYFFSIKKSAIESRRLLVEAYSEATLSETICPDWFRRFKNGDFDVKEKECIGRPKLVEDAELEALLHADSCQTQEELAESLGMTQPAISKRLKAMRMIQK